MSDHKPIKGATLLRTLQQEKYQPETLMLNLELDTSNNLTATESFYSGIAINSASKKRIQHITTALDQRNPGDILHKGVVAQILLPFVTIGKAHRLPGVEHDQPRTARACSVVAHSVLQSIKYLPNSKASGFFTKTGMIALKLENFELPTGGWSIWPASGKPIPCIFGLRVLEKIQMVRPAIMAPLNEEDQEDFEAGLEQEMVDDLIDKYAAAKSAVVDEKAANDEREVDAAKDEKREAKKQLKALKNEQDSLQHERQCQINEGHETWDETQQRSHRLKASLEQIEKKKDKAEVALGRARYKIIQIETRLPEAEHEDTLDDGFLTIELDLEMFLSEEPASVEEIETKKVEKATESVAQPAPSCEDDAQAPATKLDLVQNSPAQPYVPQVAGKKWPRDQTDHPGGNGSAKKSKSTPLPSASQIIGTKRSREGDGVPEVANKKARHAVGEIVAPNTQAPQQVSPGVLAPQTKGKKSTIPRVPSHLRNMVSSTDETADGSVEKTGAGMTAVSNDEDPKGKVKGKAKLPTPPESASSEAANPSPSPPAAGVFAAPITTTPSELHLLAQAEYHKDNLTAMNVKQLRSLLKEWAHAPPKGSGGVSNLRKPECIRVVQEALKARRKKQAIATETARRQSSGSMSQRAGV